MQPTVELRAITKDFSGVRALDGVSFKAYAGEVHGLAGENGAGKSTLMKILSGVWPAGTFSGDILIDGNSQTFIDPKAAECSGIAIVHQELALFQELTVAENIFIGQLPTRHGRVDRATLRDRTREILKKMKVDLDPDRKVSELRVGQQQLVEIAKAYAKAPKILIFDEPTSALAEDEIQGLLLLIEELRSQGLTLLYISHKFPELKRLCNRVTVLRDGKSVDSFVREEWDENRIIEAMVGRSIQSLFPKKRPKDSKRETFVELKDWTVKDRSSGRVLLDRINLEIRKGEILGIAGLMGSGRTELLHSIFGDQMTWDREGQILVEGKPIKISRTSDAIQHGFALVTEDRKLKGLVLQRPVRENMSLAILSNLSRWLKIQRDVEEELCEYYRKLLRLKAADLDVPVSTLSGGNQQKVILSRWLATKPRVLFLDEPTRGIDVVAKTELYHWMRELVDQGLTLVLVSSEMPELVSLSDRIVVLKQGREVGMLEGDDIHQVKIMERIALA